MAEFDPPVTTSPSTDASAQPFDAAWVLEGRADLDSVETTLLELDLAGTRTARSDDRILSLVPRLDLTSLNGDDTPEAIHTLCRRARGPIGEASGALRVAAVCVHPYFLELARREVEGSGVRVAVVAGGFPFGLSTLRQRVAEVEECAAQGADEIDTVINRSVALTGEWERLHEELVALRGAAGGAMLKVILATGELGSLENVAFAARTALLAGADFVKTSTGKEAVNATFPSGLVMLRALRAHERRTGRHAGFKAAGGIRTVDQALGWLRLVEETLGEGRAGAENFRVGASGLLDDIAASIRGGVIPPDRAGSGY